MDKVIPENGIFGRVGKGDTRVDQVLEEVLRPVIEAYDERRKNHELPSPVPEEQRRLCVNIITARMDVLERDSAEYRECAFLRTALGNGWLVTDIDALSAFYQTVQQAPAGDKAEGEFYLRQLAALRADKLVDRFETVNRVNQYLFNLKRQNRDLLSAQNAFSRVHGLMDTPIYPTEYPKDPDFSNTAGTKNVGQGVSYHQIFDDMQRLIRYRKAADERRRTIETYVVEARSDEERAAELQAPFAPSWGHRVFGGITKKTSAVIRDVFGSGVYDEIHEMSRGELADRKVPLHHALGTKYQKLGYDVLEMEFAGSSAQDVHRAHKERNGKIDLAGKSPQKILDTYGTKAKKPGSRREFDFIWKKERELELPNDQSSKKLRYTFAGVSPTMLKGIFNFGAYSIQSSRDNACAFAADFLKERFDDWLENQDHRKPIRIDLSGHSRGAVTAGLAALEIDKWITKYIDTHPGAEDFKDLIHYDLVLRDPVAGFGTDLNVGECDLRKIPNMNVTVFASMGIHAPDTMLPLQYVQGVKRLILTTTDHLMDITGTDNSQKMLLGNDKDGHMVSYYDSETGEMHRGSGISELPDGIYVADEKYRLVRITSYSQVNELYNSVFEKTTPQATRTRRLHKMIRDWFCENELQMSFPDARTRSIEEAKNSHTQNKLLQINSRRMLPVKAEIEALERLKRENASKEALIEQNRKLIEACRTYMRGTGMPPSGNSAFKLGLVGDTLSYTMRENNQLAKELSLAKGEARPSPLDEKIKACQERLERKEGYLERKRAAEAGRLAQEKKLLDLIGKTAKLCEASLSFLDGTRVGKRGSASYTRLHKLLEEGAGLGAQTSVNEMADFCKRFTKLSEDYRRSHDSLIGPLTRDGQLRLEESRNLTRDAKAAAETLKSLAADLGEKNTPIGLRLKERSANLAYLEKRQAELQAPKKQPAAQPEAQQGQAPGLA